MSGPEIALWIVGVLNVLGLLWHLWGHHEPTEPPRRWRPSN